MSDDPKIVRRLQPLYDPLLGGGARNIDALSYRRVPGQKTLVDLMLAPLRIDPKRDAEPNPFDADQGRPPKT